MNSLLQTILQNSPLTRAYVSKAARLLGSDIKIGHGSNVEDGAELNATLGHISIGERCRIHKFAYLNAQRGRIEIGDETWVDRFAVLFAQGGITIGKDCAIAPLVCLAAYNHEWKELGLQETKKGIVIEDHVWLGAGAIVLDGVTIGKHSAIGAGSVVTKDVPPYSVAYGNPCRPRS